MKENHKEIKNFYTNKKKNTIEIQKTYKHTHSGKKTLAAHIVRLKSASDTFLPA